MSHLSTRILPILILATSPEALAQTESSTTGALVGFVRYEGPPPPRATIHAHVNPEVCGADHAMEREDLLVSPDGGLANVVIVVEAPEGKKVTPKVAHLDQKNCMFAPHLQTVRAGTVLEISNGDRVIHNVHATSRGRTVFNLAMPRRGVRLRRTLETPGLITFRCDSGHDWMASYVVVVPHDLHGVSDATGRFTIPGLPPGTHAVRAWHELLGPLSGSVQVEAGQVARLELTYRRSADLESEGGRDRAAEANQSDKRLTELAGTLSGELQAAKNAIENLKLELAKERKEAVAAHARPLYLQHCAVCHGSDGDGRGPGARFISIMPRDFTRGEYKFRLTPSGAPPRVEDLYRTISLGVAGTEMPPWREVLTEGQRRLLAEYVMGFAEIDEESREEPIAIGDPPPSTPETVARGKQLFEELQCGQCHGTGGRGDGPSVATMVDGWGKPIRPANLTLPYFKGGRGPKVIYRTIVTGLSGSPMPSFADLLPEEDRWALVHFVLSLTEEPGPLDYLFGDPAGRIRVP